MHSASMTVAGEQQPLCCLRGCCGLKNSSTLLQGQASSEEESAAQKHRESSGYPTKAAFSPKQKGRFGGEGRNFLALGFSTALSK